MTDPCRRLTQPQTTDQFLCEEGLGAASPELVLVALEDGEGSGRAARDELERVLREVLPLVQRHVRLREKTQLR